MGSDPVVDCATASGEGGSRECVGRRDRGFLFLLL